MRRLVEVDFPLAEVNAVSSAEKKRTTGTITNLVTWFARRPQTASRAMLLAMALPDPTDEQWPDHVLQNVWDRTGVLLTQARPPTDLFSLTADSDEPYTRDALRSRLIDLVEAVTPQFDGGKKKNRAAGGTLDKVGFWNGVRELILELNDGTPPALLDCFAGGGTLPLEARRIGMISSATDINPIPLAINGFQLHTQRAGRANLAARVQEEAERINHALSQYLGDLFPRHEDGEIIALLWARMLPCTSCNVTFPLLKSRYLVEGSNAIAYEFGAHEGGIRVASLIRDAPSGLVGTVNQGKATCPSCGAVMQNEAVQAGLREHGHPTLGAEPLAMVIAEEEIEPEEPGPSQTGLFAFDPSSAAGSTALDEDAKVSKAYRMLTDEVRQANRRALEMIDDLAESQDAWSLPNAPLPPQGSMGTGVQQFGMTNFRDLYTARQLLTFAFLVRAIKEVQDEQVRTILAFSMAKLADQNSSLAGWQPKTQHFPNVFGMNAIQMSWDFYELNPFQDLLGARWLGRVKSSLGALDVCLADGEEGEVLYADARELPFDDRSFDGFFVDPPYYQKVPYNYLSNYYLVWLGKVLDMEGLDASNGLAPNELELIQETSNTANRKTKEDYSNGMASAIAELARVLRSDGIGCLVFGADLEGWTTMLQPLTEAGLTVTASWPILSERASRQRARDSSVNNASIHLLLRHTAPHRSEQRTWAEVADEFTTEYTQLLPTFWSAGIGGGDLTWACIGPFLKAWSVTERVIDHDGTELTLHKALERMTERTQAIWMDLMFQEDLTQVRERLAACSNLAELGDDENQGEKAWSSLCEAQDAVLSDVLAHLGRNPDLVQGAEARQRIGEEGLSILTNALNTLIPSLDSGSDLRRELERLSSRLQMS